MESFEPVVAIGAALLLGLGLTVVVGLPRRGRFCVLDETPARFRFRTSCGEFAIDRPSATLTVRHRRSSVTVPFGRIAGLEYGLQTTASLLASPWLGIGRWDPTHSFDDVDQWYHLAVVLTDGHKVAVHGIGQWEQREAEPEQFWIDLRLAVLQRLGLYKDAADLSRQVLDRVQRAFRERGCDAELV